MLGETGAIVLPPGTVEVDAAGQITVNGRAVQALYAPELDLNTEADVTSVP